MKRIYSVLIALVIFSSAAFATGHLVEPFVIKNATCFGGNDGKAYVSVIGGVGPFTYSWNSAPVQTTDTLFNAIAGSYTCTVTDQSDMSTATTTLSITSAAAIYPNAIGTFYGCYNSCGGNGYSSPSGGHGGYTYLWHYQWPSSEQTTQSASSLCAGDYTLTVTDGVGCVGTQTLSIYYQGVPLSVSISTTDVSCNGGSNGSATAMVSGGVGPYTYNWNGFSNNNNTTITGLGAGGVWVQVTDGSGCQISTSANVMQPAVLTGSISTIPSTSCNACNGSMQVTGTGGVLPYSYQWSNGATTQNITNLCPGSYSLAITDNKGCVANIGNSTNPGGLTTSVVSIPDTCGQSVGGATANVTGAQGPLTYLWQPGNYNTQNISNIAAGTYTLTVSDTQCSFTHVFTISNYNAPNTSVTSNPANCGQSDGSLSVSSTGGTAPYQYSINNAGFSSSQTYNNLSSGTYTIICSDANGCQSSVTHTLFNTGLNITFNTTSTTCNLSNGSSTVSASGGTGPYTYLWSNGAITQTVNSIPQGMYTCTVTDNNGCVNSGLTTVSNQTNVQIEYVTDVYYNCGNNSITVNPNYGTAPYTYSWSNGGLTTQTISNQSPGMYTCSISDANGCAASATYWIMNYNYAVVEGDIYADLNGNCNKESGEEAIVGLFVVVRNASNQIVTYTSVNSANPHYHFNIPNGPGTYSITLSNTYYYVAPNVSTSCGNNVITLGNNCDVIHNLDIGYDVTAGQDIRITGHPGFTIPGENRNYTINYSNPGTVTVNATVKMQIDNLLTFVNATPPPTTISGNLLEWNIGNISYGVSGTINVTTAVPDLQNGGLIGTLLYDSIWITPLSGDLFPSDNYIAYHSMITAPFDPNSKQVYSLNMDTLGAIDTNACDLYYTVYFQNTGNDTAVDVLVTDTISSLVDLSSIHIIGASHNYTSSVLSGRTLQMHFDNIMLPDSNANEALSHGYFHYTIRTNAGLQVGDEIKNTANIYFDSNPAIITNTVITPVQLNTVGIKSNKTQLNAIVYPNPANSGSFKIQLNDASYKQLHFTLYNVAGAKVMDKQLASQPISEISTSGLPTGIYFYQLLNADGKKISGKIVISN